MDWTGENCQQPHCGELDFLPFFCDQCSKFYCRHHRSHHACANKSTEIRALCKKCRQLFTTDLGNEAESLANHEKTCEPIEQPKCERLNCPHKRNIILSYCPQCHQKFCLHCRAPATHDCSADKEERERKEKRDKKIISSVAPTPPPPVKNFTGKNLELFRKVTLMKIRSNAIGHKEVVAEDKLFVLVRVSSPLFSVASSFRERDVPVWLDRGRNVALNVSRCVGLFQGDPAVFNKGWVTFRNEENALLDLNEAAGNVIPAGSTLELVVIPREKAS